ncbi:hypothetical protein [Lentisalinibacter salinarum]|uniref:hypothetical protein n=1 Tax=Lentisalinibacter salinarum TaxID=2992239 RepID=UPI00386B1A63
MKTISGPGAGAAVMLAASVLAGCASAEPKLGMAVEDFEQACFESDRARGKLVFAERNREIYFCDLWDTHYVFEDGILVSIEQELSPEAD